MGDYLESLVFLYPTVEAAQQNVDEGGSGFLLGVEYKDEPARAHVYVVTNKHVSDGSPHSRVAQLRDPDGQILDLSHKQWVRGEEDDVAVCSLMVRVMSPGKGLLRPVGRNPWCSQKRRARRRLRGPIV
jgi:hypothetical protein